MATFDIEDGMARREMALTILRDRPDGQSWQSGSFLGQLCACPERPLSDKQREWFLRIIERAGLGEGGA